MTAYRPVRVWSELTSLVSAIEVQDEDPTSISGVRPTAIMPTPYAVLGAQFRGRLAVVRQGQRQPLERSGVTVLQSDARTVVPDADARSVLVTLHPLAAYTLFARPMQELADQHVGLAEMLGTAAIRELEERLADARSTAERAAIIQRHLLTRFAAAAVTPHPVVADAVRRLLQSGGRLRIRPLAEELAVSERQLERLFREQVGVGPKRFASLAQFDWAWKRAGAGIPWSALAAEAGYADQAHLTRTFVQRTGQPPSHLLAEAGRP